MNVRERLTIAQCLPVDRSQATLIGRVWSPAVAGPIVALAGDDALYDVSHLAPTVRDLLDLEDPIMAIRNIGSLPRIRDRAAILANSSERAAEGGSDRAAPVVAVSRSWHRSGCRDIHQVAADVGGWPRRGHRPASEIDMEQSRARNRARREQRRPNGRRNPRQRRQPARLR